VPNSTGARLSTSTVRAGGLRCASTARKGKTGRRACPTIKASPLLVATGRRPVLEHRSRSAGAELNPGASFDDAVRAGGLSPREKPQPFRTPKKATRAGRWAKRPRRGCCSGATRNRSHGVTLPNPGDGQASDGALGEDDSLRAKSEQLGEPWAAVWAKHGTIQAGHFGQVVGELLWANSCGRTHRATVWANLGDAIDKSTDRTTAETISQISYKLNSDNELRFRARNRSVAARSSLPSGFTTLPSRAPSFPPCAVSAPEGVHSPM
jgi:hypothetical protein